MSIHNRQRFAAGTMAAVLLVLPAAAFADDDAAALAAQGQADTNRKIAVASMAGRLPFKALQPFRPSSPTAHALVEGSDVIDYYKLIRDVFEEAALRRNALQNAEPGEKRNLEAAKKKYAEQGKSARNAKKAAEQEINAWSKGEKKRIKQIKDKAPREAADRGFKAEERNRRDNAKRIERNAQSSAKTEWQTAQRSYKSFQQELKNARFEAKSMPRYEKHLKPHLLTALKDLNQQLKKTSDEAGHAGGAAISLNVIAALRPDIVRGYLRYVIGERVRPAVDGGVDRSLDLLFKVLDKVVGAAIKAIVTAVGSVPFVGGALAAVAAATGEAIYNAVKKMVTNSVRKVGSRVCLRLIEGISSRLASNLASSTNAKDEAIIAAVKKAVEESNRHLDTANARYGQQVTAAKAEGYNLAADAAYAARKLSSESETENKVIANGELEAAGAAPATNLALPASAPLMVFTPSLKAPAPVGSPAVHQAGSATPTPSAAPSSSISWSERAKAPWSRVAPGELKQIAVGSATQVWGLNGAGAIYRRSGGGWEQVGGVLKNISVGSDGTVWGVNGGNEIYRRDGNDWTKIDGALKQISVGSAQHVWGVAPNDRVYRWNGKSFQEVGGLLINVAVAADGTVWGVNSGGAIFRRDGNGWNHIGGVLQQIAVADAKNVWGVSKEGAIYRWNGNAWDRIDGALKWIGIATDGSVWGVNGSEAIYRKQ